MTEMEFWESCYLTAITSVRINGMISDGELHAIKIKNMCAKFADFSAHAWKIKSSSFREEEVHRKTCIARMKVLREFPPGDKDEADELADLEAQFGDYE